jgi:hypothetical protein
MSLLMKALEKAAQDRDKTPAAPQAPGAQSGGLSLETVEIKPALKADEDSSRVDMSPKRAAAAPPRAQYTPSPAANKSPAHGAAADTAGSSAQTRAATVLNAQAAQAAPAAGSAALAKLMARPVYLIGALAGLIMLGYGVYVYIQIAHPSLLIKSPPRTQPAPVAAAPVLAPAAAPVPASAEPLSTGAPQPADTQPGMVTMQSVLGNRAGSPGAAVAGSGAGGAGGVTLPPPPATLPAVAAPSGTISATTAGTTPAAKPAAPPAAPATLLAPRVAVSSGDNATPRVNALVSEAYAALQARQFDTAQRLYSQVVRSEPGNVDAPFHGHPRC